MFCPKCGKEIADDAVVCVGCGRPIATTGVLTPKKESVFLWFMNTSPWSKGNLVSAIIVTVLIPIVGLIIGGIGLAKGQGAKAIFLLVFSIVVTAFYVIKMG